MKPELFWITGPWRGHLAVIARPRGGDWLDDEMDGLRGAGFDVVVSLLERAEAGQFGLEDESAAAGSHDMRFISFPIPDRGVPGSASDALSLMGDLLGDLRNGKNIAIHCRQGIGRSGVIAIALLVLSGSAVEDAIANVSVARGRTVPETTDQIRWLKQLAEHLIATS